MKHPNYKSPPISVLLKVLLTAFIVFAVVLCQANKLQQTAEETAKLNSFQVRGFHIDLRIQVMTMPALKSFAKELADFDINTIVMEWEASYPYQKHASISNKYSYTRDEVKGFIAYCDSLGIDVIPLQQCFGHAEYILRHSRYNHLREIREDLSQVCPLKVDGTKELFTDLFTDMASLHTSEYIHIGGDETRLLGRCRDCRKKVEEQGEAKLFSDYLVMLCEQVVSIGKTPVLWADMVLQYPEVIDLLPKQTVYIDWNYAWDINLFGDINNLLNRDIALWGAPAIRSHPDNWYTTDWEKHFNNQRDYIPFARGAGYNGMVMTSWSTSGVYGYTWDTNMEVLDMHAMRNVYPMSGFRIIIAAYAEALKQTGPIDPKAFVAKYAMERFGFSLEGGQHLWDVLCVSPEIIPFMRPFDVTVIDTVRKQLAQAQEKMDALKPLSHQKEFDHLSLMLDLRAFYLDVKKVESVYESDEFTYSKGKDLLPELERLLVESKQLDDRFSALNEGYLYPQEIAEQNAIRNQQLKNLYDAVTKTRTGIKQLRQANFPRESTCPDKMPSPENLWIFIMAGQSNMAGRGIVEPKDTLPNPRILTVGTNNEWLVAKEPLHLYQPKLTGLDCGMSFAQELLKHVPDSVSIGLIPCAVGGTSIKEWLNDLVRSGIPLFSNLKEKTAYAMKYGALKGVIWHQGESDATAENIPLYRLRLKAVLSTIRHFSGDENLPVIMGELGTYVRSEKLKKKWQAINSIIHSLTEEEDNTYLVPTRDLSPNPDYYHFNSESQRMLGKRYAQAYLDHYPVK